MTQIPTDAQLLSGNAQAVKFAAPGDSIDGIVVSKEVRPITKMGTGEVDTYKSGAIKYQILATLQTNLHEDGDDDGLRTLYIKSYMTTAMRQAVQASGAGEIEIGAWMRVTFTHFGEAERGMSAPKMFVAEYRRPDAQVLGVGTGDPAAERFGGQANNLQYGPGGPRNPLPPQTYNAPVAGYQPPVQQQPSPQPAATYNVQAAASGQPAWGQQQPTPQPPPQQAAQPAQQAGPTPEQVAALLAADPTGAMLRRVYPNHEG